MAEREDDIGRKLLWNEKDGTVVTDSQARDKGGSRADGAHPYQNSGFEPVTSAGYIPDWGEEEEEKGYPDWNQAKRLEDVMADVLDRKYRKGKPKREKKTRKKGG